MSTENKQQTPQAQPQSQPQEKKPSIFSQPWMQSLLGLLAVVAVFGAFFVFRALDGKVSIENSMIEAPVSALGPTTADVLDAVYVKEGDTVSAGAPLAKVGSQIITAKTDAIVVSVNDTLGALFNPGEPVVSVINPADLRVVGQIDEDKGLSLIKPGQPVTFTVDAFGSKTFDGIVDSISPTADTSAVAWSISDQRLVNKFDVKVRYDVTAHPEFKNGMSARMTVFVK